MDRKTCQGCGGPKTKGLHSQCCLACRPSLWSAQRAAQRAVQKARRDGVLLPASRYACMDCGKPAAHWDHRDYSKPLEVEPTCISCNFLRGTGKFPVKAA